MITDAEIYQGEYVILRDTVYADASLTTPKSLVNATAEYRLGHLAVDEISLRVLDSPNANGSVVVITDPTNGVLEIVLRAGDTLALPARQYDHQVIVTDSAGKRNVVTNGVLIVHPLLPAA